MSFKLKGEISNEAGQRVSGAKVVLFDGLMEVADVTTAADGGFKIERDIDNAKHDWSVTVSKAGYTTLPNNKVHASVAANLKLVLKKPGPLQTEVNLSGQVYDSDGQTVAGAELQILAGDTDIGKTKSGGDGAFKFTTTTPHNVDHLKVEVTKKDFEIFRQNLDSAVQHGLKLTLVLKDLGSRSRDRELTKTTERLVKLSGHVVRLDGQPVVGAQLKFLAGETEIGEPTETRDDGYFQFSTSTGLHVDRLRVKITKQGFHAHEENLDSPDQRELRLTLRKFNGSIGKWIAAIAAILVVGLLAVLLLKHRSKVVLSPSSPPSSPHSGANLVLTITEPKVYDDGPWYGKLYRVAALVMVTNTGGAASGRFEVVASWFDPGRKLVERTNFMGNPLQPSGAASFPIQTHNKTSLIKQPYALEIKINSGQADQQSREGKHFDIPK